MSLETTVRCDGCSTVIAGGRTATVARDSLAGTDTLTALPGGRDYCPECAQRLHPHRWSDETQHWMRACRDCGEPLIPLAAGRPQRWTPTLEQRRTCISP